MNLFDSVQCLQTLERSYLLRVNGKVVERPQHMLMRVSVGIHQTDIDSAIQTYHMLSERWFTHASPTLFNAGTPRPQLSSCFLICMKSDSIEVCCSNTPTPDTNMLQHMHKRCEYVSRYACGDRSCVFGAAPCLHYSSSALLNVCLLISYASAQSSKLCLHNINLCC